MECPEAALKTSFRKDMAMKLSPQTFTEDSNGAPCEDFLFVDDLLDFSHVEEDEEEEEGEPPQPKKEDSAWVSPLQICHSPNKDEICSLPTSELSVPEDVADLEWLSHFVEDSFSVSIPTVTALTENPKKSSMVVEKEGEPKSPVSTQPCFKTKARSKRTRTGVRVWPLGSPTFTESSSTSSSSSSAPPSPLLFYTANLAQSLEQVCSPPKRPKKKPSSDGGGPRRCSHCGVQKTPQWRTGPLGAKTLCNACGVRYKSGRLLPEYRPACSPTFSTELHSNHHRKVLEMRRKKEGIEPGLTSPPVVPSF